jgi:hypothetical protein
MRKFLAILGVTALAFTSVGVGSAQANGSSTDEARSGLFCAGFLSTLTQLPVLSDELNLLGFTFFAEGDFEDPELWPEGFPSPGTAGDLDQDLLDEIIANILGSTLLAEQSKGAVPADVEAALDAIFDVFDAVNEETGYSVQTALDAIFFDGWSELADTAETIPVAATIAQGLTELRDGDSLGREVNVILDYIEDTGCITFGPDPVEPGNNIPAFCNALITAVDADYVVELRAILTEASVADPFLVDDMELMALIDTAYTNILAGNSAVPGAQADNWYTVTEGLADLYFLLDSFDFFWPFVFELIRASLVERINSTEPIPEEEAAIAALETWYLANCLEVPPTPDVTPTPVATPRFTG